MAAKVTIEKLAECYGTTPQTLRAWRHRTGLETRDFLDVCKVSGALVDSAKNCSPRLEKLCTPETRKLITERINLIINH